MEKGLCEICNPKQWKTISSDMLTENGYPVYGANGIIGYYTSYNHEEPTILITCRGATCGTLNICESFSYVNGNAMALDNLSEDYDNDAAQAVDRMLALLEPILILVLGAIVMVIVISVLLPIYSMYNKY